MAHGTPLSQSIRNRLAHLVERDGEAPTVRRLGISRATLTRALAGLGLREVSRIAITVRLDALDTGERLP